jgi:hypothetical protein
LILQKHNPISAISSTMQEYADRSVFRSFSRMRPRNGIAVFRLVWFHNRTFELVVDTGKKKILLPVLLPRVPENLYKEFKEFIRSHQSVSLLDHRRIDKSKVIVRCARRQGNASITLSIKDGDLEYALRRLIHLMHETFVIFLADGRYRDYAVEELGADSDW